MNSGNANTQREPWIWDAVAIVSSKPMDSVVLATKLRQAGITVETFYSTNTKKQQAKARWFEAMILLDEGLIRCNLYGGKSPLKDSITSQVLEVLANGIPS